MRGLLGRQVHTRNTGLLGLMGRPAPIPADAGDEHFLRLYASRGGDERVIPEAAPSMGLLAQQTASSAGSPRAPERQGRERVSGWRVLDRVLGGQTITEGLDAERERLREEALRPALEAQREQILAGISDPRERALFMTDPEAWAENIGYDFRPRTLAPGSVEVGPGGQVRAAAPVVQRFDDRFGVFNPLEPDAGATYTDPRGPTFDEVTGRQKAENDAALAAQRLDVDRYQAGVQAAVGLGGLDINRQKLELERGEAGREAADAARAQQAQASEVVQTAENMAGALQRSREFVRSAGVWSQYNPLNRQARANLEGNLDTLRGNLTFDKLMDMKANSPTGASGLGALSDNEARLLASTAASLSADMSPQELERSFQVIDRLVAKMRDTSGGPSQGGVVSVSSPQEAQALPPGTRYRAPNGRVYIRE